MLVVAVPDFDSALEEYTSPAAEQLLRSFGHELRQRMRPGSGCLVARRYAFGWCLSLRVLAESPEGTAPALQVEHVLRHETVSANAAHVLLEAEVSCRSHPADDDPAYLRRGSRGPHFRRTAPCETSTSRDMHRTLMAVESFRLESLAGAYAALDGLDPRAAALDRVALPLREVVLESLSMDRRCRLAQVATHRPALLNALGVALGNRPGAWTHEGELVLPLERILDGRKDRDVLAAALEVGLGLEATGARIARLRGLGSRMATETELLSYLPHTLDVDCPDSWIPSDPEDLDRWALAQCWAQTHVTAPDLRRDFERYVARYGAELGQLVAHGKRLRPGLEILDRGLPARAHELFATRVGPNAFFQRELERDYPPWVGDAFLELPEPESGSTDDGPLQLRRIRSDGELRAVGRRFRNCLVQPIDNVTNEGVLGKRVHISVQWRDGEGLASVVDQGDGWEVGEVLGPRNRELPDDIRSRVEKELERIMERIRLAREPRPVGRTDDPCERPTRDVA